jgi:hypothetical protein
MIVLLSFLSIISILTACNKVASAPKIQVPQIMDVAQYSRMTPEELITKLGEPLRKDEWIHENSKGQKHLATSYNYEIDQYPLEFIIIDNTVVKMNVLTSESDDNQFKIEVNKDVFALAGITPTDKMITLSENSVTLRYASISDLVSELWVTLEGREIRFLQVTYNSYYFK